MKVLIAYGSKHGATQEIAQRIFDDLKRGGVDAEFHPIAEVSTFTGYDAFVVGSAVYFGKWLHESAEVVRANRETLSAGPTWMFSSGPTGTKPIPDPKEKAEFEVSIHPVDHVVFGGVLDRKRLSFAERAIIGAVHAPYGDFRDWPAIDAWATGISAQLTAETRCHDIAIASDAVAMAVALA
jgi:menaquinone-dependent protoporphyrinogen oxidase